MSKDTKCRDCGESLARNTGVPGICAAAHHVRSAAEAYLKKQGLPVDLLDSPIKKAEPTEATFSLPDRLRRGVAIHNHGMVWDGLCTCVACEAADEIERLTEGIRERIESWRKKPVDNRYYAFSGEEKHFCADDLQEVLDDD